MGSTTRISASRRSNGCAICTIPYQLNIEDAKGSLGLDLGVYGAPETFFVDAKGIIRHKFVGTVDERVWRERWRRSTSNSVDQAQP